MNEPFVEYFSDKKILILGFGVEGKSTYRFLRKIMPEKMLCIADCNPEIIDNSLLKDDKNLSFQFGLEYLQGMDGFDMIIKTPGLSLKEIDADNFKKFTSHTELFFRFFRNQIIGITGTKGKSTTASLIHHIISSDNSNCLLVGNIGQPPFDMIDRLNNETIIVYELSSHQLEQTNISPRIAILLNLFQEHLDHYASFEKYQEAKFKITAFQYPDDYFIFHGDDKLIKKWILKTGIIRNFFPYSLTAIDGNGCYVQDNELFFKEQEDSFVMKFSEIKNLQGDHNLLNIMAAINAVRLMTGMPFSRISEAVLSFKPLEHRLELVGEYDGIIFYNDSISTIPEATIAAVKALKKVDTLLLGGYDRGIFYDDFIDFLENSEVSNLIFIGDAGKRMHEIYCTKGYSSKKVFTAITFEQAVAEAKVVTRNNTICLLSPAAASYGMFKNFAERGSVFKSMVKN